MSVEQSSSAATERAYDALQSGAVLADRSDRLRMTFSGAKAAVSLTGIVTSDVVSLAAGQGQYSAALTPKGKVLADIRVFARADHILVDTALAAAQSWTVMIRKFVNPRLARYEDVSPQTGDLGLFGRGAADMLRATFGNSALPADMPEYAHVTASLGTDVVMIARTPDVGVEGYDLIGPRGTLDLVRTQLVAAGAIDEPGDALLVARIEAGRPEWGVDMDDTMLAQEVDLDRLGAISFAKGCYTGQETVARIHYRGHVNRQLRGVRLAEPVVLPVGTELVDAEGKFVGAVRSGAISPRRGSIAFALIRREIEPGTTLRANGATGAVEATVGVLPFIE